MSCCLASAWTARPWSRAVALVTGPIETMRALSGKRVSPSAARKYLTVELEVKVT